MEDQEFYDHIGNGHDGEWAEAQYDARGIYLTKTCSKCHDRAMRGYRPEVLTDPGYECNEPIDPED